MDNEVKTKRKGLASMIVSIVLCIIFIPVILINVTLIVKTYTNPDHLPDIFGVKPVIVLSGSMSPVFEAESLIFVKKTDASALKEGDIICYMTDGTAITHRIDEVKTENGQTSYITKGDANNTTDATAVTPDQVEGIYIGKINGLGGFAMFMQSTTGMICFIILPVLLYLAFDIWMRRHEAKKEKSRTAQLEAELEKLRASKEEPSEPKMT